MSYVILNENDFTETGFSEFGLGFNENQLTESAKFLHQRHGKVYFDDGLKIGGRKKLASEMPRIK